MRRKEKERDAVFALDVISRCDYAVLAMTGADGLPYAVPLCVAAEDSRVYFHCAREGQKTLALMANPNVCLTAVCGAEAVPGSYSMTFQSAVAFGTAALVEEPDEMRRALWLISQKYMPGDLDMFDSRYERGLAAMAVWRIDITGMTGKESSPKA